jgi:hypothetical protein
LRLRQVQPERIGTGRGWDCLDDFIMHDEHFSTQEVRQVETRSQPC